MRLVFRPDPSAETDEIQAALMHSIGRLVGRLVEHMDEVPFLKKRLRFLLIEALKRGERPAELETLAIFPMIQEGEFLSLQQIIAKGEIHVTYDPPFQKLGFERTGSPEPGVVEVTLDLEQANGADAGASTPSEPLSEA